MTQAELQKIAKEQSKSFAAVLAIKENSDHPFLDSLTNQEIIDLVLYARKNFYRDVERWATWKIRQFNIFNDVYRAICDLQVSGYPCEDITNRLLELANTVKQFKKAEKKASGSWAVGHYGEILFDSFKEKAKTYKDLIELRELGSVIEESMRNQQLYPRKDNPCFRSQ